MQVTQCSDKAVLYFSEASEELKQHFRALPAQYSASLAQGSKEVPKCRRDGQTALWHMTEMLQVESKDVL